MKKKVTAIALVVATLAIAIVGATLAYFTDTSSTALNTFTIGKVDIDLDEAEVDDYGTAVEPANRVIANEYKLVPNHTYVKDPTTTVLEKSEPCYVRTKVKVTGLDALKAVIPADKYPGFYNKGLFLLQKVVGGWDKAVWDTQWSYGFDTDTYQFRYIGPKGKDGIVDAREKDVVLEPLFTTFTLPSFLDNDDIKTLTDAGFKIEVTSDAIQADQLATADAAWEAFDAQ